MTHGCGEQGGECLWKSGGGPGREGQKGKNWDNCNRITVKYFLKTIKPRKGVRDF